MLSKDKGVTGFFRGAFLFVEIYFRKCRATYKLYLKRAFHKGVAKRLVGCPFLLHRNACARERLHKDAPVQRYA